MNHFALSVLAIGISVNLIACNKDIPLNETGTSTHNSLANNQPTSQALVRVNGKAITSAQLEYALSRLTSGQPIPTNQALSNKVLDSLISSRAMALLQESTLTPSEHTLLALKVAAYREELLVKDYINAHAIAQPVTQDQVKNYYLNNLKDFGGDNLKTFEYIQSAPVYDDDDKAKLTEAFNSITFASDWKNSAETFNKQGLNVSFKKAKMREQLINAPFKAIVEATPVGQQSAVQVGDTVWILKVTNTQKIAAKPFAEVSHQIRKTLAPQQIKAAIKAVSEQALSKVDVEFEIEK